MTGIDSSEFANKADLASLKSDIDKLDIDKLETVPTDLSELGNVVENDVVKKTVYHKLVEKVNVFEPKKLSKKTGCDTKIEKMMRKTFGGNSNRL